VGGACCAEEQRHTQRHHACVAGQALKQGLPHRPLVLLCQGGRHSRQGRHRHLEERNDPRLAALHCCAHIQTPGH
jgi:hypothetical protein